MADSTADDVTSVLDDDQTGYWWPPDPDDHPVDECDDCFTGDPCRWHPVEDGDDSQEPGTYFAVGHGFESFDLDGWYQRLLGYTHPTEDCHGIED